MSFNEDSVIPGTVSTLTLGSGLAAEDDTPPSRLPTQSEGLLSVLEPKHDLNLVTDHPKEAVILFWDLS